MYNFYNIPKLAAS